MANPTHHVIIDIATNSNSPQTSFHHVNGGGGGEDFSTSGSGVGGGDGGGGRFDVSSQPSNESNSRLIRGDSSSRTRRSRSPLNSGFLISLEFIFTLVQIIASVIVLNSSRNEHSRAPKLFVWIVGYATGCIVSIPLFFWRYYARDQNSNQTSSTIDDPSSGTLLSDDVHVADVSSSRTNQASWFINPRMKLLKEYFKICLELFFAIWFIVGNVWIFGANSAANEAPNLYRLCVVFLTFSCIGYAMPFILCLTICCCLPCIISTLGDTEDHAQTRGATTESINALPIHKFKLKKSKSIDDESTPSGFEGGIVAGGTEKERVISGEDAVCCICIANYENEDELRELACSHLFHKDCVDKWLKINALCPLCKSEVGGNATRPVIEENASQQSGESRVQNALANTSS